MRATFTTDEIITALEAEAHGDAFDDTAVGVLEADQRDVKIGCFG